MAVILQMTYQKKLGLPNYSSHACSVSLTVEIPDASVAAQESTKLYALLQTAVDNEIQRVGFMPDATTYGMNNGNGSGHPAPGRSNDPWNCTDGQKGLILRLVNESRLEKLKVEDMAQGLFGLGVRELDKMQASQLIEDLLEKAGRKPTGQRRWSRQPART